MEVYYTVVCNRCDKPEPKDNENNLIRCMDWLDKNEKDFDKDGFWDLLFDYETIKGNDTYCKLPDIKNKYMKLFKNISIQIKQNTL